MIASMTGFGEGVATRDGVSARVSARSLNLRQLEVRVTLPSFAASLEAPVVELVRAVASRGRVEIRAELAVTDASDSSGVSPALVELAGTLRRVAATLGIHGELTLSDLLSAGGAGLIRSESEPDVERVRDALLEATARALEALTAFRRREGEQLDTLYRESVQELSRLFDRIELESASTTAAARERLRSRVRELVSDAVAGSLDRARLELEVVLVAERSDIAEELQRARLHAAAIEDSLRSEGPHGKRLDFLLQELVRETNTMASKSSNAQLTHLVVDAKTIVDRLREQAQNIE